MNLVLETAVLTAVLQPRNPHVLSGQSKKESSLAGANSHIWVISFHLPVTINTHTPGDKPTRQC